MRILMVNKFLYPNGGSETYVFRTGEMLARLGHEVEYFGMEHEGRVVGNRLDCYTESLDFHAGGAAKLLYPFKILYSAEAKKKITKVLADFRPDVVHLNNINFQLTPSVIDAVKAYDPGIRIVYTAHDYQWICPNHMLRIPATGELCGQCQEKGYLCCLKNRCIHGSALRSALGSAEALLYRMRHTYRMVDVCVCPSQFMKDRLEQNPDLRGRCILMRNFTEQKAGEDAADTGFSLPARYVLYFGRFDEEKGIDTLLAAAGKLPDIPFVFAGKGEKEAEVRALPNGTFLGFLSGSTLLSVIRGAACTVYPSEWYENGPFSIVESELAGTPVIGSSLGGIPELVIDGKSGLLFPAGDADALSAAIRKLYDDPVLSRQMGEEAGRFAKAELPSLEAYCRALLSGVYQGGGKEKK